MRNPRDERSTPGGDGRLAWGIIAVLLLIGVVRRSARYLVLSDQEKPCCEAINVAASIVRHGSFADPFGYPSGPTAHLSPVMPALVAAVYRLFGIGTGGANAALAGLAMLFVSATVVFLYLSARSLGCRRGTLVGVAVLAVAAPFAQLEITQFLVWEGALATALSALTLWSTLRADKDGDTRPLAAARIGALSALTFLVSPPVGLAMMINAAVLTFRSVPRASWFRFVAAGILAGAVVLTPWTVRNIVTFGRVIPVRGNAGLEVALTFNNLQLTSRDERQIYTDSLLTMHPDSSAESFARMRAMGGESAYADALGRDAMKWLGRHPGLGIRLAFGHLVSFYLPPPWVYAPHDPPPLKLRWRAYLYWPVPIVGLLAVVYAVVIRRGRFVYLLAPVLIPVLPYTLVNPSLRYCYLVQPMLIMAASIAGTLVVNLAARRFGKRFHGDQETIMA